MKTYLLIFLLLAINLCFSQIEILREHCHCGVSSDSYNNSKKLDTATFTLDLPNIAGLTVKKAFLMTYYNHGLLPENFHAHNPVDTFSFFFDNQPMTFYEHEVLVDNKQLSALPFNLPHVFRYFRIYLKDISAVFDPNLGSHSFTSQGISANPRSSIMGCPFFYKLIVIFESPLLDESLVSFVVSEAPCSSQMEQILTPYILDYDSLHSIASSAEFFGWHLPINEFYVNNMPVGHIGGIEYNGTLSHGSYGTYSFYNDNLNSFANDTANQTVNGTDVTLYLNDYIDSSLNLKYLFTSPNEDDYFYPATQSLMFSSTCDSAEFPDFELDSYSFCSGESLDLVFDSSYFYEWTPVLPYDTASFCHNCNYQHIDSSTPQNFLLTIRKDSGSICYKRFPLFIVENQGPKITQLEISADTCNLGLGKAILEVDHKQGFYPIYMTTMVLEDTIHFNDTVEISNLISGNYNLHLTDSEGCSTVTNFSIQLINNVIAAFTVSDTVGFIPMTVGLTNTSENAQSYQWLINGMSFNALNQYTFSGTPGDQYIQLVAYGPGEDCVDTTYQKITLVKSSLLIDIPNVITPNGDGVNDNFGFYANKTGSVQVQLINRWGNSVLEKSFEFSANSYSLITIENQETRLNEGVLFYSMTFIFSDGEEVLREGYLHLER